MFPSLITPDALYIVKYIKENWHQFEVLIEVSMKTLFLEPENKGLKHIWTHGSADIVVKKMRGGRIVCIIEPGGAHHLQDEKQIKNDARKFKLCELNDVKCLHLMNGTLESLSNRQKRKLIGKYLW